MKFQFMDTHRSIFSVERMARVLQVSVSGYYAFRKRGESKRAKANRELLTTIKRAFEESKRTYGSPRITAFLKKKGYTCSRNRVARLMRKGGYVARGKKRYRITTNSVHAFSKAPNLLGRAFQAEKPNTIWCSDITYIPTKDGWLYLSVIMDLYSRKVVGWEVKEQLNQELTLRALQKAVERRRPFSSLLHHSDQGIQYSHPSYQDFLEKHGIIPSMSRKGSCYDNAVVESFFKTLKTELIGKEKYKTREEANSSLFAYIEGFYNSRRLHSTLGYRSPEEFERQYELG
ncbi:MAG: IS3 family transposase [Candidatus Atribacteria bacterium]|nr:IS3 family transposase [Candidatus Atribacteria bacterium]